MEEDMVSFNSVSLFVVNLLYHEPNNVTIGLGGIGLGAAVALYYASSYTTGVVNINLQFIIGINGWLPAWRNLESITNHYGSTSFAPSLPILLTHGNSDNIVPFQVGNRSAEILRMAGFPVIFIENEGDHYPIIPQVIDDVRSWLTTYFPV
ncbi:PREDICTED: acyl-protein thioesterase 1-like [Camelina sativa]|uniref:Acyl-protein thioesterase 1-like n=1 Tax=Camelina sativa TaxID=90675 RepID=A0ABM1QQG3_CAMSA|nr:PREDICTED: acyl-protein thioesterase 1-like [Camelina sativa]